MHFGLSKLKDFKFNWVNAYQNFPTYNVQCPLQSGLVLYFVLFMLSSRYFKHENFSSILNSENCEIFKLYLVNALLNFYLQFLIVHYSLV